MDRHRQLDPVRLFRFALREGDLPLAALLAAPLGRDPAIRPRLGAELERSATSERPMPSLAALQMIGIVLRGLSRLDCEDRRS
jgi:hypothetical protein